MAELPYMRLSARLNTFQQYSLPRTTKNPAITIDNWIIFKDIRNGRPADLLNARMRRSLESRHGLAPFDSIAWMVGCVKRVGDIVAGSGYSRQRAVNKGTKTLQVQDWFTFLHSLIGLQQGRNLHIGAPRHKSKFGIVRYFYS